MPRITFHRLAEAEFLDAEDWYELNAGFSVAEQFIDAIENATREILKNPRRWPKVFKQCRKYSAGRFPYSIIYTANGDRDVFIIAFAHAKRRPFYWKNRWADSE